jgi:hypothetical protein
MADIVAKGFCAPERATLIQDQAPMRNVDAKIHPSRFDCCAFLLTSCSSPTFATTSALNVSAGDVRMTAALRVSRPHADVAGRAKPDPTATLASKFAVMHNRRRAECDRLGYQLYLSKHQRILDID